MRRKHTSRLPQRRAAVVDIPSGDIIYDGPGRRAAAIDDLLAAATDGRRTAADEL